ncbi:hypothetical protein BAY61_14350 [Prauserella marina]|uniref:Uncharacterized protein n=1 Tax=Prauserella marina TaxID=530584 RepID=A0A222VQ00_9PSEU|nr:hypothetical protein [Prauserella marina]ASR35987.1 hypothetical protein BAY61_14350 [Prauserella marina]PWV84070.1 hypothetical protein DES30_10187 [Prauserella marina]SDC31113.1 hypothetical protein SAMN05421630_1011250 [Prauserella marina]
MTKLLLSVHVLAAILAIGPIAVAASLFPRYARAVRLVPASGGAGGEEPKAAGVAAVLHRICRGYAVFGLAVPVFGFATGAALGVLTDVWLIASVVLTAVAAALLVFVILPGQREALTANEVSSSLSARLSGMTGVFNLLWAVVVVLMIVRPGSTTGV